MAYVSIYHFKNLTALEVISELVRSTLRIVCRKFAQLKHLQCLTISLSVPDVDISQIN